jgi:hypothetical protein
MSTLTGQQINLTYPGLLNLETSTTGITSSFQQIQDGLGNNTNTRISTSGIVSPNIVNMNNLKPDYGGIGFIAGAGQPNIALTQNRTLYGIFYDTGVNSYSAITYQCGTVTSTSDVVTMAIYSLQLVPGIGIAPKDLIISGVTMISNSTGIKTTSLPSTLSFSGTGGGYYIVAYYVSNGGSTPTVRYTNGSFNTHNQSYATSLGLYLNAAGTGAQIGQKYGSIGAFLNVLNLPFQTSYSQSDITTNYTTSITTQPAWGIALNTIF